MTIQDDNPEGEPKETASPQEQRDVGEKVPSGWDIVTENAEKSEHPSVAKFIIKEGTLEDLSPEEQGAIKALEKLFADQAMDPRTKIRNQRERTEGIFSVVVRDEIQSVGTAKALTDICGGKLITGGDQRLGDLPSGYRIYKTNLPNNVEIHQNREYSGGKDRLTGVIMTYKEK